MAVTQDEQPGAMSDFRLYDLERAARMQDDYEALELVDEIRRLRAALTETRAVAAGTLAALRAGPEVMQTEDSGATLVQWLGPDWRLLFSIEADGSAGCHYVRQGEPFVRGTPVAIAYIGYQRRELSRLRVDLERLRGVIETLLASAHPNPTEHPTMTKAWALARAVLAGPQAATDTHAEAQQTETANASSK